MNTPYSEIYELFKDIIIKDTTFYIKNVTPEEVANMTVVMLSQLSSGVTGEIIYVDGGYNIMGV